MKKRLLGLTLLVLGMLSAPRGALADPLLDGNKLDSALDDVLVTVGFGVLDLGLAFTDMATAAQRERLPRAYGGFETLAAGGQFAICLDNALSTRNAAAWWMGAGIGALFVVHGIVTLVAPGWHLEVSTPTGPVAVTPLALSDVARTSVPGVGVLGRF